MTYFDFRCKTSVHVSEHACSTLNCSGRCIARHRSISSKQLNWKVVFKLYRRLKGTSHFHGFQTWHKSARLVTINNPSCNTSQTNAELGLDRKWKVIFQSLFQRKMSSRDSGLVWNCIQTRFIGQVVEKDRYVYEVLLVDINWAINNINAGKAILNSA